MNNPTSLPEVQKPFSEWVRQRLVTSVSYYAWWSSLTQESLWGGSYDNIPSQTTLWRGRRQSSQTTTFWGALHWPSAAPLWNGEMHDYPAYIFMADGSPKDGQDGRLHDYLPGAEPKKEVVCEHPQGTSSSRFLDIKSGNPFSFYSSYCFQIY